MARITLTTTGWRTGLPRSTTVYAFPDGDALVVTASNGGAPADPAWAGNLRADPRATVGKGRSATRVRAREVGPDDPDRDRLWRLVSEAFPWYATYQHRTERPIPLFVLEPDPPAVDASRGAGQTS